MPITRVSNHTICQAVLRTIENAFPSENPRDIKIADLGCLHGYYSFQFAEKGYDVTGIEAREINFQKCTEKNKSSGYGNLRFIKDDVKNLQRHGSFDVIFCNGLLYHLDRPVGFLNLLSELTSKLIIIQTHYSIENDSLYDNQWLKRAHIVTSKILKSMLKRKNYNLSTIKTNEGYLGRWFNEYKQNSRQEEIEKSNKAAYSNHRSFWLTKPSILEALVKSGCKSVYEQFDYIPDIHIDQYQHVYNRGLFIGAK